MDKSIITFSANEQNLQKTGGIGCYASDTVSYIEAHFDLGDNWSGYDSIRAVWFNDYKTISTVLDSDGVCIVPHEVLVSRGKVMVNLVGSVLVSDELKDRLTTFPCEALKVSAKAKISGSETTAVTPSQFEQFVSVVISEVEKVTGMTAQAETLPAGSQATARYENGILYLGIPQGIRGERGETGADGADGNGIASVVYNADYSLTLVFDNGERFTTPPIRGERGPAGADGRDGTDGADGVTPNLSIGNVTTLEPSEDAYVTRRGTDANPIFDFGIPKGDPGTVPDLDLILPTDTASGDIVSIPDGQSVVPVKSLKVTLEPIQDLHGYDKPWSGGNGKNKLDTTVWVENKYIGANGVIGSENGMHYSENYSAVKEGTYTISITRSTSATLYVRLHGYDANKQWLEQVYYVPLSPGTSVYTAQVTISSSVKYVRISLGATAGNIQLEEGSTATAYEPYSNICPISGRTEVDAHRTRKNILPNFSVSDFDNGTIYGLSTYILIPLKAGTYTISNNAPTGYIWAGIDFNTGQSYTRVFTGNPKTITVSEDTDLMYGILTTDKSTALSYDAQIEVGSTATDYEPYDGTTYTTALGRTVYGGTPDVVSGECVINRYCIDLSTLDYGNMPTTGYKRTYFLYGYAGRDVSGTNMICSHCVGAYNGGDARKESVCSEIRGYIYLSLSDDTLDGLSIKQYVDAQAANGTPVIVSGLLDTHQTIQLTPQQVMLLTGNNNVWSDGSVEVTYNADVGLYIDKKLGTSGTRTLSMTRTLDTKSDDTDDTKTVQLAED